MRRVTLTCKGFNEFNKRLKYSFTKSAADYQPNYRFYNFIVQTPVSELISRYSWYEINTINCKLLLKSRPVYTFYTMFNIFIIYTFSPFRVRIFGMKYVNIDFILKRPGTYDLTFLVRTFGFCQDVRCIYIFLAIYLVFYFNFLLNFMKIRK